MAFRLRFLRPNVVDLFGVGDIYIQSFFYLKIRKKELLPAIRNVHLELRHLGIKKISVSTTFSFVNIITTPSSATFQEPLGELIIKPLLQFLDDINSSFLVNLYPYNMYRINSEM